uniref:Cytochrome c oxidase subunit 3 n=9 Tax=Eucheuma denticulatum TaxID=305493 RepID=A0A2H4QI70_9FLOR|nr:cytochrome c oxidase subunit 3 [Eucheuma denticulatum]ATX68868.1 cytochrome c oxidase subunit 3 [Eucheuma denticulatum]
MKSFVQISKVVQRHPFHLVDPSPWPFVASLSAFSCACTGVMYMHAYSKGSFLFFFSFIFLLVSMYVWWRDVIRESTFEGHHTGIVQQGLRFGVILFIVSEILFFFAFFWAFFHSSLAPTVEIGSIWPPKGINVLNPWEIPFLNTLILLLSGCTVTWSHHAIVSNLRSQAILSLFITIILAGIFTTLQAYEYNMADFRLSDGIYGSTFYMATGFHGFHVLVGTMSLCVCFFRLIQYQLTQQHHFGFESSAWYWHFVDVVWLFLFVSIYWWGSS